VNYQRLAVIYTRVSSNLQEEEGTSLDTQTDNCTAYAYSNGMRIVEVFREVFTGSLYRERALLTKLRQMARNKEFDVVIINTFDRLSRNQTHLAVLIDEMEHLGISIDCVKEKLDDTSAGQFMRSALGFVAQIEREKIIERTYTGRRKRAQDGKLTPGPRPKYGYKWANEKKEYYLINKEEAIVVRRIYDLYVNQQNSLHGIARILNNEGVLTAKGRGDWNKTTVKGVLTNSVYTGRGYGFSYQSTRGPTGKQTMKMRPENERIPLPEGVIPPIISEEMFHRVQEQIEINKMEAARNNPNPKASLLRSGFIRCGYCKRMMSAVNGHDRHLYICNYRFTPGQSCGGGTSIRVSIIDDAVWQYVGEIIQDFSLIQKAIELVKYNSFHIPDIQAIEQSIKSAKSHQEQLVEDLRQSESGVPKLKGRARQLILDELEKVENYLEGLEHEMQKVLIGQTEWEKVQAEVDTFIAWCLNARETYSAATYEEKRRALRMLGIVAYIYRQDDPERERYEIKVNLPDIEYSTLYCCCPARPRFL